MNKSTYFIETLHHLWMTDALDMQEFMEVTWALMIHHGVRWQPSGTYLDETGELIDRGTAEEGFEYDVNDNSKSKFANFETVCLRWMDFSAMVQAERRAA